jgi:hypothetical protein
MYVFGLCLVATYSALCRVLCRDGLTLAWVRFWLAPSVDLATPQSPWLCGAIRRMFQAALISSFVGVVSLWEAQTTQHDLETNEILSELAPQTFAVLDRCSNPP